MPITSVSWKCDRDAVEATSPNEMMPEGWTRAHMAGTGTMPVGVILCPACSQALRDFIGPAAIVASPPQPLQQPPV